MSLKVSKIKTHNKPLSKIKTYNKPLPKIHVGLKKKIKLR